MGTSSRRGMFAVLRLEDLGLIGEKGTKVSLQSPESYALAALEASREG